MTRLREGSDAAGNRILRLESDFLQVDVAPGVGGRVVGLLDKAAGHEFLWRNPRLPLERLPAGSEYDPNFFGGIDELLPNDIPEVVDGLRYPDHGELWTAALAWECARGRLRLRGTLPICGLQYEREMSLREEGPWLDVSYRISNLTAYPRSFLWKLHAALNVAPGDRVDCPARRARVVDPAWSRYHTVTPFAWPELEGQDASVIPAADGTMDFFYLYELDAGRMAWRRPSDNLAFAYHFDRSVFPYAWMFASYGGFNGHYTVILEPCTAMPLSLKEAAARKQCSHLPPGTALETRVSIRAGREEPAAAPHRP